MRAVNYVTVLLALLAFQNPASAQILNTLRGWSEPDPGWSLEVDGKLSYSRGNTDNLQIAAGASVQFVTAANRFRFMISDKFQSKDGERSAQDFRIHLRHNYRLSETYSSILFVQNEYNPYKRLERRTLFGAGIRADLISSSSIQGALGTTVMLESIELTDGTDRGSYDQTRASLFISLIAQSAEILQIDLSGFYQPLLKDFSDQHILMMLCVQTSISETWALTSSLEYSFSGNPPDDVEDTDVVITSGFKISL